MSNTSVEPVLEPHTRYVGTAQLFINGDASWSIGPDTQNLVKVRFADITSINDGTFGFSAIAVDKTGTGYTLYVKSDADGETIVEVKVDATGNVDPASLALLTDAQIYAAENTLSFDINGNGGFGAEPVVIEGGSVNLYVSAEGVYQLGNDPSSLISMTIGGQGLSDRILPAGWEIVEVVPTEGGFEIFAQAPTGEIFDASFNSAGEFTGGSLLDATGLAAKEASLGVDINGDASLPADSGWTSVLKDAFIKAGVDSAAAGDGKLTYAELSALMTGIVANHKAAGNSPITADELSDLQALAARGKALFAGSDANTTEYLSFVFSKLVEGSPANQFYTGGQAKAVELGNLSSGASVTTLERLVDKWLLGGDLPSPTAGGDTATGKANTTVGVYAQATGPLVVDGIAPADVKQGVIGDCFLVAALVSVADAQPTTIEAMIVENGTVDGSRTWGVRFFDAAGQANWVTVNDKLPVEAAGSTSLIFASKGSDIATAELWVPLIEKAYAQANSLEFLARDEQNGVNGYWAVEGGSGDPLAQVLGGKLTVYTVNQSFTVGNNPYATASILNPADAAAMASALETIVKAMNAGQTIWIGSDKNTTGAGGAIELVAGHAFAGIDADKADPNSTKIAVWNPWGFQEQPAEPGGHVSPFVYELAELIALPEIEIIVNG